MYLFKDSTAYLSLVFPVCKYLSYQIVNNNSSLLHIFYALRVGHFQDGETFHENIISSRMAIIVPVEIIIMIDFSD